MNFLPDVYVQCEVCKGARYNRETLQVKYKDKSISDVLKMTVEEALAFCENLPKAVSKLQTLVDVGLGYIQLGQPATTLSGGEAQRVKLATELSRRATGKTLYLIDEPTTGLSFYDVHKLLDVIQRLVDNKIKTCNWKTDAQDYGTCFFRDDNQTLMGVHFVAGSHRRWNERSKKELEALLNEYV